MKRNLVKLLIDALLSVIFVLLFNTHVIALPFHEVCGIGIGFGILVHILLNLQWVRKVSLRLFDSKLPIKTRLGYVLNLFLLIAFALIIVSGILISKVLFPNLRVGNEGLFRTLHVSVSYLTLVLIGIHIGLHWKWVMGFFKNAFKIKSTKTSEVVARVFMIIFLLFGGYQLAATNFVDQIANINDVFTMTNSQTTHDGFQQQTQQQRVRGRGSRGDSDHSFSGEAKGQFQSPNALNVLTIIIEYSGIMSVFVILTYYMERFLTRKKHITDGF
ncbi:DUF4405 domain-containing protein [Desulfosporosinus sp. FKB]|uniref:DUF4405 domain-containing protein n=1 Tax=Desulfosporosinus sp. FKB TaxID=1969835 RepID=UPI00148303F4|nr:DUF4405 domain-containing protein [Desulfosporosinus sp. FKB]